MPRYFRTIIFFATCVVQILSFRCLPSFSRSFPQKQRQVADDGVENTESDRAKWEEMYSSDTSETTGSDSSQFSWDSDDMKELTDFALSDQNDAEPPHPVEVVSYDLDDTLWPTKLVITAANDALESHMNEHYPDIVEAGKHLLSDTASNSFFVPLLMRQLHNERRKAEPNTPAEPIDLTELRKAAILKAAVEVRDGARAEVVADSCFLVWRRARHQACEYFMFDGVIDSLNMLNAAGFVLGAITNGNADISEIPCLAGIFTFSVTSEEVGESKPSPLPFYTAAEKVGFKFGTDIGRKWVHIGDDFGKDCAPAKALKMRTVWVHDVDAYMGDADANNKLKTMAPTQRGAQPLENIPMENGVYKMSMMGSGDYLAQMVIKDAVDATVKTTVEAAQVVLQWHTDFEVASQLLSESTPLRSSSSCFEDQETSNPIPQSTSAAFLIEENLAAPVATPTKKFCVECGAKLPREAKFCIECGSRQPILQS